MASIERLLEIMARLRDPAEGCPWDLEQDFASIAPYTIEEAYEVEEAVRREDREALCHELGDLLLQVVYHAQMARERNWFGFEDVVDGICQKLVRRHPHIFADAKIETSAAQIHAWEEHKAAERAAAGRQGAIEGIPLGLPALLRAGKLQQRAERVGFDWSRVGEPLTSLAGEIERLAGTEPSSRDATALARKLGDLLFGTVALARRAGLEPEQALREANARFERRFQAVEGALGTRRGPRDPVSAGEWLALWQRSADQEDDL